MKNKGNILKAAYMQITLLLFVLLCNIDLTAQTKVPADTMPPIPTIRQLSHDYIMNSENDLVQYPSIAEDHLITRSIRLQIFENRKWIETNTTLSDNEKFKWLRGINNLLFNYLKGSKQIKYLPQKL